jgi:hypothetical protein
MSKPKIRNASTSTLADVERKQSAFVCGRCFSTYQIWLEEVVHHARTSEERAHREA